MEKLTKLNGYNDAILVNADVVGCFDNAIYKLNNYERTCDGIDALKNEYSWLLELNDDNLAHEVINSNNVQNALIELLKFVDDIMDVQI